MHFTSLSSLFFPFSLSLSIPLSGLNIFYSFSFHLCQRFAKCCSVGIFESSLVKPMDFLSGSFQHQQLYKIIIVRRRRRRRSSFVAHRVWCRLWLTPPPCGAPPGGLPLPWFEVWVAENPSMLHSTYRQWRRFALWTDGGSTQYNCLEINYHPDFAPLPIWWG